MLACSIGMIRETKEKVVKVSKSSLYRIFIFSNDERILKRLMMGIIPFEKGDEVFRVNGIERAMLERLKALQIGSRVMQNELMRIIIHHKHKLFTLSNDCNTLAPGEYSCKKPGYFNILFFSKQMRNKNRIRFDEAGTIKAFYFFVEELLEF